MYIRIDGFEFEISKNVIETGATQTFSIIKKGYLDSGIASFESTLITIPKIADNKLDMEKYIYNKPDGTSFTSSTIQIPFGKYSILLRVNNDKGGIVDSISSITRLFIENIEYLKVNGCWAEYH